MKVSIIVMVVCLLVFSASAQPKVYTVHGEIVEVTSYVKEGIKPTSVAGKEIAMANLGKGDLWRFLKREQAGCISLLRFGTIQPISAA